MMKKDLNKSQLNSLLPGFLGGLNITSKQKQQKATIDKVYVNAYQITDKTIYKEPSITTNDYKQTLDNYRKYIAAYNKQVKLVNVAINKYNFEVKEYHALEKLTISNFNFISTFQKNNKKKDTWTYNKLVEKINTEAGIPLLFKRKVQTIKLASERIFETVLYFYGSQIESKTTTLRKQQQPTARVLSKLVLNYYNMQKHKRNGIERLNGITKKTIQNHIKRLKEAKIILNYQFINQNKPVRMEISSTILVISDLNPYKRQSSQNQSITSEPSKKLHHSKDIQFSNNKKIDKKNTEYHNEELKESISYPADGLQNYKFDEITINSQTKQEEKRKKIAPKKEKDISSFIAQSVPGNLEFAKKLSQKQQMDQLDEEILSYEANYGYLNRKDFTQVIIQQILLLAFHSFYKNHKKLDHIYAGNWYKTVKMFEQRFMIGDNYFRKTTLLETYFNYKTTISNAKMWFDKNEFTDVLTPFEYFDPTRTHNYEVGFQFMYKRHLKYIKQKENKSNSYKKLKSNLKSRSKVRKETVKFEKMYQNAVKRYETGKYQSLDMLYNYVLEKLPKKYIKKHENYVNNR